MSSFTTLPSNTVPISPVFSLRKYFKPGTSGIMINGNTMPDNFQLSYLLHNLVMKLLLVSSQCSSILVASFIQNCTCKFVEILWHCLNKKASLRQFLAVMLLNLGVSAITRGSKDFTTSSSTAEQSTISK